MIDYRWQDRRDHRRQAQVFHAVDMGSGKELCDRVDPEDGEVIQGAMGGDLYCVDCWRELLRDE